MSLKYSSLCITRRSVWLNPWEHSRRVYETLIALGLCEMSVIVVSDCQRILGLGDLGANVMPIPVSRLLLYSARGGIEPAKTLPVVLDVRCDIAKIRDDPYYLGVRKEGVAREQYDVFVEEFMTAARKVFSKRCLVQFEDFCNNNAACLLYTSPSPRDA